MTICDFLDKHLDEIGTFILWAIVLIAIFDPFNRQNRRRDE